MIDDIKKDTEIRMKKCIEVFKNQIGKIRTGCASPNLLNNIMIKYHGGLVPIQQLANVIVENAYTLKVNIFDKSMKNIIEKAIIAHDPDLNPHSNGTDIFIIFPPLTEERRKNFIKIIRVEAEQARIAVRNIRRDANDKIRILLKEKKISENNDRYFQDNIQKITHSTIKKIDEILTNKELELTNF